MNDDDELIDHIKSELNALDFDYKAGAWENFLAHKNKRRKIILWQRVLAAAAVLIIAFFLIPGTNDTARTDNTAQPITQKATVKANTDIKAVEIGDTKPHSTNPIAINASSQIIKPLKVAAITIKPAVSTVIYNDTTAIVKNAPPVSKTQTIAASRSASKLSTEAFLANEDKHNLPHMPAAAPYKKWAFGVSLGQALDTRNKTNLNIGTQVTYAFNSRLAISTGIYYNELGAAKKYQSDGAAVRTGKFLNKAETNMRGIDIPIELQYKLSKKMYARVGVSAYSILSQQQTLQYNEQRDVVNTYVDAGGELRTETITVNEVSTESVPQEKLKQNKYVGLYNLSFGYQQKISGRHALSLEPYIKIPTSGFSEQDLNLVQGGLRVKVDF